MKRTAHVMTADGRTTEVTPDQLVVHVRLGLIADRMRALLRTGRSTEAELLAMQQGVNDRLIAVYDDQALDDHAAVVALHAELATVEARLSEMEEA